VADQAAGGIDYVSSEATRNRRWFVHPGGSGEREPSSAVVECAGITLMMNPLAGGVNVGGREVSYPSPPGSTESGQLRRGRGALARGLRGDRIDVSRCRSTPRW
jgi:hypothetical protein